MAKRGLCILLALAAVFSLSAPALAEEEPVTAEEAVTEEVPVMKPEEEVEEATEPVEVTEEPVVTEESVVTEETVVTKEPEEAVEEPEIVDEEVEPDPVDSSVGAVGVCGGEGDGTNLTWVLSPDGVLTISGTGKMKDYTYGAIYAPWYDLREQIKSVVIQNGVTNIGDEAFNYCLALTDITIPNSVTSIGDSAFNDCASLTSLTIPNSVTSIRGGAFQGCDGLTSITIPASVTNLGNGATFNMANLTDIYVDSNNKSYTSVDGVLFSNDETKLICYPHGKTAESCTVPNTVKSIGDWAFANCIRLTNVTIPSSVISIGSLAFTSCTSLTNVTLPVSVTSIGLSAFSDTPWLESQRQGDFAIVNGALLDYRGSAADVTIPNGVTSIVGAFLNRTSLTSVTIPNSVTSIGANAFSGCTALTNLTIPESVTSIGILAFITCTSLSSITIPASVTSIGAEAFDMCTGLKSVTILNPNCSIDEQAPGYPTFSSALIKGYTGSTAETYAKQYGYKFEALDQPTSPTPKPTNTPKPTATPKPQLAAPTVKIEKVSTGIKVSWNKISGAPRYMVYYKENNGGWKKIGTTTATSYTRAAKYLKSGVTYQFTVRCCENDKKTLLGPYKASNSLKYTAQLAAPTVKIAKVAGGIKVSWNKITGSPRYMVYYKENGGGWKKIGTTTSTTYTRAAKYLKNGVTYQFTVRCCANDKKTLLGPYKASNSLKYTK